MAATGTREWASHSANVLAGCEHACVYCYAHAMAERFGRVGPAGWRVEVPGGNELGRRPRRVRGAVMYPTTHDLTPANQAMTIGARRRLLRAGNHVLVVTKPHLEVIRTICRDLALYRGQVLFRFTIGAADDRVLALMEPGAPRFGERLAALEHAHAAGWATSVSMEPLLETDEDRIVELVDRLTPHVTESIWLGRLNRARATIRANGAWTPEVAAAVRAIEASQTDARCRSLARRLASHPLVRWKESIKRALGAELASAADEHWVTSPRA